MSELDDRDPCKTGPRTTKTEKDLLAMLDSASYDLCRALDRAAKAEAKINELEGDLVACREFQDIAEARVKELEAELAHSILDATALLVDRAAKAEARVKELESALERIEEASTLLNMDGTKADHIDHDEWWHIARAALGKE